MQQVIKNYKQETSDTPARSDKSLRLLVIDDSKTARFAMRKYLERLDYLVDTVSCASEAYDYLEDHCPDVIFLDNIMPGINGIEVLAVLQKSHKTANIPVIFCTSIENNEFITNALEHGARKVLQKPPTLDRLSEALNNIGKYASQAAANSTFTRPTAEAAMTTSQAVLNSQDIQQQIDASLQRLKNELAIQISELQSQLSSFDISQISENELRTFREIAQEEAETLNSALRAEMAAIHKRLDEIALVQLRSLHQSIDGAPK